MKSTKVNTPNTHCQPNKDTVVRTYPLSLVQKLLIGDNRMELPKTDRFTEKEYNDVKALLLKAGGKYRKSGFDFEEPASVVYDKLIGSKGYNVKKELQLFETPETLADELVALSEIKPGMDVLEPSAGRGRIVNAIFKAFSFRKLNVNVGFCELSAINKDALLEMLGRQEFLRTTYICADFMSIPENVKGKEYDRIIANPPFTKNQDINHIYQMYDVCKTGGRIVTIASIGWQRKNDKTSRHFKEFLDLNKAKVIPVAAGAFKESGTSVPTCIIIIDKPEIEW